MHHAEQVELGDKIQLCQELEDTGQVVELLVLEGMEFLSSWVEIQVVEGGSLVEQGNLAE